MIRGTTPTHEFTLSIDPSLVKDVEITYGQNDVVVLTKHLDDCTWQGNTLILKLTQQDTFGFDHKKSVRVQLRALLMDNTVVGSYVKTITVEKCLSDEVLA